MTEGENKHDCISNDDLLEKTKLNIENLDSGDRGFVLKFYKESDVATMVRNFITKYPKQTKIKPDNKLVFTKELLNTNVIQEASNLLEQLENCNF